MSPMIPNDIQTEMERRRIPGAVLNRLRSSRGIVASLLGRDRTGVRGLVEETFSRENVHQRYQYLNEHAERIGPLFGELSDADRRRLVRTLLPGAEPAVDAAWKLLAFRPYQSGMARLPFRAPRSAQTLAAIRGRWLLNVATLLGEYEGDIAWVAASGPHLAQWWGADEIGWLLAGAVGAGGAMGDEVFGILKASATGEHPVGQMGRHVVRAFLSSDRPAAWEYTERLLLAAQRQEGLRQVILESVDEAHPDAFRRMIRLIRDENLGRFSSVVRAMDTWFGFQWDGASGMKVDEVLERVSLFLDDTAARDAALDESDAETVYLALWSTAFEDIDAAVPRAARLLTSPSAEVRYVAAHFLAQSLWSESFAPLAGALRDSDLRVAARALDAFHANATEDVDGVALFDALESLIIRLPKRSQKIGPLVWPWTERVLERTRVAAAMSANAGKMPASRMLPYVRDLDPFKRESFIRSVAGLPNRWARVEVRSPKPLTPETRELVLDLLGDASADVRGAAFEAMGTHAPQPDETERIVELLSRKPSDLRSAALRRLGLLDDAKLLAAADRLTGDADAMRRLAGLELLRGAAENGRASGAARERMRAYRASRESIPDTERAHLDAVLGDTPEVATLDDALGLVPGAALRSWPAPVRRPVTEATPAARAVVESLAALVLAHAETEVETADGERRLLLEAAFLMNGPRAAASAGEAEAGLPLRDTWKAWLAERPAATRDSDGLEFFRALLAHIDSAAWKGPNARQVIGSAPWSSGHAVLRNLLEWCAWWAAPRGATRYLVDGLENAMTMLTDDDLRAMAADPGGPSYFYTPGEAPAYAARLGVATVWLDRLRWWRIVRPEEWGPAAGGSRVHGLLRWFRRRTGAFEALDVQLEDFLSAFQAGLADSSDFVTLLL
ncbi:MAG TPA: hypothetical protein VF625_01750, partial [Longimicrobium sp.]